MRKGATESGRRQHFIVAALLVGPVAWAADPVPRTREAYSTHLGGKIQFGVTRDTLSGPANTPDKYREQYRINIGKWSAKIPRSIGKRLQSSFLSTRSMVSKLGQQTVHTVISVSGKVLVDGSGLYVRDHRFAEAPLIGGTNVAAQATPDFRALPQGEREKIRDAVASAHQKAVGVAAAKRAAAGGGPIDKAAVSASLRDLLHQR